MTDDAGVTVRGASRRSADGRIRVLHTLGWITAGGVEQLRLVMARGMPKDRYEHVVICQEAGGVLPDQLRAEGWTIHVIGLGRNILDPAWHLKAVRIARAFRPDVVHGAVIEGVALATSVGLALPGVAIVAEETSDPVDRSWRGNLLMRAMCLRSDAAIGVSPRVGDYLTDIARVPRRKVRVIDNAVLPAPDMAAQEVAALRAEFGLAADDFVLGSAGRLQDDHKRFSDLIRATRLLLDRGISRIRLLIVGDGQHRAMLEELARSLDLGDRVVFTGYRGDVRRFYPVMDVFALASAHEAFGLVLAEAMMAGVPVVATEVGGIPHVLDQGRAGRLVPPLRPDAICTAVEDLWRDAAERRRLGEVGRTHAHAAFSADRYCREIDDLYRSLLR